MTQHTTGLLGVRRRSFELALGALRECETNEEAVVSNASSTGGVDSPHGATRKLVPVDALWDALPARLTRRLDALGVHLLPRGFLAFQDSYFSYARWYMVGAMFGSASMVLSTQSMLYAVGLGAGAIPVAAALNWVLKDGIGQVGGVLFASCVNNRFDADPKRWRMVAALALDAACILEALTPFVPFLFLPIASVANAGKNISWLAASATRANIHQSFARKANLADVTAKAGSQTVVASTVGTALGVAISPILGSDPTNLLPALVFMSGLHLSSIYKALQQVSCDTLNPQRASIVTQEFLKSRSVPTPRWVSSQEAVFGENGFRHLVFGFEPKLRRKLAIGCSVEDVVAGGACVERLVAGLTRDGYFVHEARGGDVGLIASQAATSKQILGGYLEAMMLCDDGPGDVGDKDALVDEYVRKLEDAGWNTEVLFLEEFPARVSLDDPTA